MHLLVFIQQTSSASCCCCNSSFSLHLFPLLISFELRLLHGEKSFTTIIIIIIAVSEDVAICRSLDREAQVSRQQQHHQKCCSCFAQNVLRSTARKSNWCSVSSLRSQEVNVFTISLTNHFGLMIISAAATAACLWILAERPIINLITDATPACTLRMQSRVA